MIERRDRVDGWPSELTALAGRIDRPTAVVVAMLAVDAVWWWLLVDGFLPTPGGSWLEATGVPMAAPGAMTLATIRTGTLPALGTFALTWGVMMWAMMHPTMTRFTRAYAVGHRGGPGSAALALAAFLAGYLLVWLASAVLPLTLHGLLPGGTYGTVRGAPALAVGGALAFAGTYQLSSFKRFALRSCCDRVSPHRDGARAAFRRGLGHGLRCVAVCFGLFFVVMPFVGAMNRVWTVALTAVVAVERLPTWGDEIATGVGLVALVTGVLLVLVRPDLGLTFVA